MAQRTIADFERGARAPFDRTLGDIQSALESAGVCFLSASEEGGEGVRFVVSMAKDR